MNNWGQSVMSEIYRGAFQEAYEEGYREGYQDGYREGFREGLRIGMIQVLFWAVQKGYITVEEAAEESEMTVNEFNELLKNPPAWVTQDR